MLTPLLLAALAMGPADESPEPPAKETAGSSYELGLAGGLQLWRRAYGGLSSGPLLRLRGRRDLADWLRYGDWLVVGAQLDWTRVAQSTKTLSVSNQQIGLGASAGALHWFGLLRVDAGVDGGLLLEWSHFDDSVGVEHGNVRLQPQIGGSAGAAFEVASVAAVGLRGGVRFQPGRLHIILLVDVDWLVRR